MRTKRKHSDDSVFSRHVPRRQRSARFASASGRSSGRRGMASCRSASPRSMRALPGGGLALGAVHEIIGAGGDEEDGAAAAGFAAGILARLSLTPAARGPPSWCEGEVPSRWPAGNARATGLGRAVVPSRPDLMARPLAHGLDPARLVLVPAPRDGEILWAMEEGLRAPGIAAVVGEVGPLAAVASRRLQLAAERSGITAFLLRRWRDGGQAARERDLPNAAVTRWRIAALPSQTSAGEPGSRTPAVAGRAVALPRRRAGMLGSGGRRCDGSCISGCRAGRSTGCACRRRKNSGAPAEEAPFATVADAAGRRLLAAVNPAAAAAGLAPGMPLADALSFLPGLATAPAEPAEDAAALRGWRNGAAATARGPLPTERTGCKIEITGSAHLWGGEAALAADLDGPARSPAYRRPHRDRRHARRRLGDWPALRTGKSRRHPAAGRLRAALAPLPVEALRLDPATAQGLRRVGLKRVGDLYCDAARRARPPFRRNGGAAARSGAGRSAGAVVAVGRSAGPAGAAELCRADCRSRRSAARNRAARRRISFPAWRGRGSERGGSTSPFTASTAGSSGSASAPLVRAAIRATSRRSSRSGSTPSIPVSASKT